MACIPVIDLQLAAAAPEEAARLRDAAQRLGCFRVAGHGVPRALQDDMKAAVRALFDLPDDAKRRNADVISGSGYVAPSAKNPLYEAFGLYDAASPADVDAFCASLHAPPHIRETVRRYAEKTHDLIVDVAAKLAASLGLEEAESGRMFQDWPCQFRINRYNYTPDTVGEAGVQVHTDSGFLTVLHEDDRVGGLQVADRDTGEFAPVDPVPGTFLVNLGDVATVPPSSGLPTPPTFDFVSLSLCVCIYSVGVEQRGAAQREAPRAVRGGGAARLHRALPAGAQGRRGPRAGRLRRRRQPPPLQDFRLRRLPPPPAVHRGACRGGPGTAGRRPRDTPTYIPALLVKYGCS